MHDAFLIDFHANKQAGPAARMVFAPTLGHRPGSEQATPLQAMLGQTRPGQTSWPLCGYINSANGTPGSQPASLRSFPSIHFLFSPPPLPPPPRSPFSRPLYVILCLCKCFVRCCCCSLLQMLKNRRSTLSVSQKVSQSDQLGQVVSSVWQAVWQSGSPSSRRTNHVDVAKQCLVDTDGKSACHKYQNSNR